MYFPQVMLFLLSMLLPVAPLRAAEAAPEAAAEIDGNLSLVDQIHAAEQFAFEDIDHDEMILLQEGTIHAQDIYEWISRLATASQLAYQLPDCTTGVKIEDQDWAVSFCARQSGARVQGKPALLLTKAATQTMIISVPGTIGANDWISNSYGSTERVSDTKLFGQQSDDGILVKNAALSVHSGFLLVAESIIEGLLRRVENDPALFASKTSLYFTGHSQGGAVTSLLALYAATHRTKLGISPDCKIRCMTFASPRVYTKATYAFYKRKVPETYRIFNPLDIVPRVPFGKFGFRHVGHPLKMESSLLADAVTTTITEDLSAAVFRLDMDASCRVVRAASCLLNPSALLARLAEPHSMDHYHSMVHEERGGAHIRCLLQIQIHASLVEPMQMAERAATAQDPSGSVIRYAPHTNIMESSIFIELGDEGYKRSL